MKKKIKKTKQIKANLDEVNVSKKADFEMYLIWRSLPSFLRGKSKDQIANFGFEDPLIVELFIIKTQKEFAEKFSVNETTLVSWNKKIKEHGLMDGVYSWAKKLTRNVVGALYRNASIKGSAQEVRAWFELIEKVSPEFTIRKELDPETKRKLDKLFRENA